MKDGINLKYGLIYGPDYGFPINVTDSETIKAQSGRYATRNSSTGYAEIADTTEDLIGWLELEEKTSSSDVAKCLYSLDAVFRAPLIYDASSYTVNYSAAILFEACDLKVSSGKQYVNPTAATNKSVIIVGGKAAASTTIASNDGYIDSMINPNSRLDLGVGA